MFRLRVRVARRPTLAVVGNRLRRWRREHEGDRPEVRLVTVAFNNPAVIALQRELLAANLTDRFEWVVADNSSRRSARQTLRAFCHAHDVPYLPLPKNPYTGRDPSRSHAEALNHLARWWLAPGTSRVVGFLDHDVFPIRPTSIVARMGDAVAYGRAQEREGTAYLWPGLLFLRADRVDLKALDFRPWAGGDTGAGLQRTLYASLRPDQIAVMADESRSVPPAAGGGGGGTYQVLDDWCHTENASSWRRPAPTLAHIRTVVRLASDASTGAP